MVCGSELSSVGTALTFIHGWAFDAEVTWFEHVPAANMLAEIAVVDTPVVFRACT